MILKGFGKRLSIFSDKGVNRTNFVLVEEDEITEEDSEVAQVFDDYFANVVKSLNINIPITYTNDVSPSLGDSIDKIILKYSNHPSIKSKQSKKAISVNIS